MAKVELKAPVVAEIAEAVKDAQSVVLVDYRGLTVDQDTALRKQLRAAGVTYKVYKNTMMNFAFKGTDFEALAPYLEGPSAIAISTTDATAPARELANFAKTAEKLEIKGGVVEGNAYDAAGIMEIAKIPGREALISRLLGSMQSPITNMARVLNQIAEKGGAANCEAAPAEEVTLKWAIWDQETTQYWGDIKDAYEASHPGVTIEMVDLGSTDYMTVLATQLAGSADLDIVTIKDIPGYANLINLDYLKPLNEVLTRDTGDFNGTIEQLTTDDGNFYAVPFRSDFWVLYYNKDLFDKAGVEYPSNDLTMEDYDALARKMTSGSGDTKVYGCHYHTWRSAASLFSILDGKNTIIDGKYDFMKPTYDMVIAQQKDGICMDYGYLKTSSLHYSAAFENQQCAMVNMGSWFISTLEAYMKDAETKFNWGIVKYPHPAGAEAGSTLGTVTSLAINADSPKAEAAADFINWCVSEEGAQAIAKTGTFPACGSAATAEIIKSTEGFPEDSNSVDALTTSNVYLEMPYTQYASDIETILNAEHDAIMTMSETVDEGIQNMNDQVPAVLG